MITNGLERWTNGEVELLNGTEGIGGPAAKRMTTSPLCAGWTLFQHDSGIKAPHARVAVLHQGNGNSVRSNRKKLACLRKVRTLSNGRGGAKTATEHMLRLRNCGSLTTWGLILVFLVLNRACDAIECMEWSFISFAALNLPTCHWLGCSRAFETSQECLDRGTR